MQVPAGWTAWGMERESPAASFFTERTLADYPRGLRPHDPQLDQARRTAPYKLGASRRIDPADVEDFLARHRDEAA